MRGSFLGDTTIRLLSLATWVPIVITFNDHVATITAISGGSMYPYYNEDRNSTVANDMVLTWKWNPMDGLRKGMIVTFRSPFHPETVAIKRIVALEGEYVTPRAPHPPGIVRVPQGHIWVEGDGPQGQTLDSNTYGPISMALVTGRSELSAQALPAERDRKLTVTLRDCSAARGLCTANKNPESPGTLYLAPADNSAQTIKEGFSVSSPAAAASSGEDRHEGQTGGLLPDIRINRQSFGQDMISEEDDSFEEEGRPPYLHAMIAGGLGGSTGDMLMHSLDTVKTRQQGDPHIPPKYTSLGSSYHTIWRQEGIRRGLYGGWVPALSGSLPGTMLFFGTYEWSKRFLIEHGLQHHLSYLTAGFLGDLAGSVVYVPSEVLKTRMQLQGRYNNPYFKSGYNYRGTVDAARTIVRHEGLSALFHGYQATLYRDLPFSALQFMFWEQFHAWARTYKQSRDVGVPLELLTGGLAGSLAGVMTCPLDVVKTRLQTQVHPDLLPKESKAAAKTTTHASTSKSQMRNISTSSPSTHTPRPGAVNLQTSSVIQGLKVIYQTEGLSGWFRGVGPRGVWTFIQSGTMLFLYQRILKQLEVWNPPVEAQREHAI
ncbi:putative mitochondrial carrier [Colletotrichum higginsianum]|nr:putative mitochondrial carrier [Colletotrichum higginsianum]